ncbi:MAG: ParA family protein [Proteobacteria bacterium]|nr:ParA family protein [Pseudomonadota bacterium]
MENKIEPEARRSLLADLSEAMGPFLAEGVLEAPDLFARDAVFATSDAVPLGARDVWRLDRVVTGAEWVRAALPNEPPRPPRATLFGVKGGVGRSTAICVWSWHLATRGKKVLVVDLDLEAPGVSSMLLSSGAEPDYGLVDWLVEDAVGNADDELGRMMIAQSSLADGTPGQILVAPCGGTQGTHEYTDKLARAYVDIPTRHGLRTFAGRVAALVDHLERITAPDVVLIDSRSGIHDLAAIATVRLGTVSFLFAVDTRQTWDAYRILLSSWSRRPQAAHRIRAQLQMVAAQVPETHRVEYLARTQQRSYDLFADTLYEEAAPDDTNAFNFDVLAAEAPHYPLPVYWSRAMQAWEPTEGAVSYAELQGLYGEFLRRATDLVVGDEV